MSTIDNADQAIGARVRQAREAQQKTRSELAEALGIDTSIVSRMETGAVKVSASRLQLIARFLGVPVWVFFDEGRDCA